jgi:hypothetical protein
MDESYYRDRISGYFDRSLPPDEWELVDEYLKSSEEGRKLLAELGRLDEFARLHGDLGGSEEFWERRAQRIEERLGFADSSREAVTDIAPPRYTAGFWWKMSAAAASIAFLVFIGIHQADVFDGEPASEQITPAMAPDSMRVVDEEKMTAEPSGKAAAEGFQYQDAEGAEEEIGDLPELQPPTSGETGRGEKAEVPLIASPTEPDRAEIKDEAPAPQGSTQRAQPSTVGAPKPIIAAPRPVDIPEKQVRIPDETAVEDVDAANAVQPSQETLKTLALPAEPVVVDVSGDDYVVDSAHLAFWREQLASANSDLEAQESPGIGRSYRDRTAVTSLQETEKKGAIAEARLKMAQACFQIARLTNDSSERERVIQQLKALVESGDPESRELAQSYLDSLSEPID